MCHMHFRPYRDYNLASHGRPNRFILTENSLVAQREGGGGVHIGSPICTLWYKKPEYKAYMLCDFRSDE